VDTSNGYHLLQDAMAAPWGCCRRVRQRPPLSLKMSLMAGPLGGAASGSGNVHHRVLMMSMAGP
jgi:hypothetical protein